MSRGARSGVSRRRLRVLALAGFSTLLAFTALGAGAWAAYSSRSTNPGNELLSAADWTAPSVSTTVIGKTQGGIPGYIHQGGTYNVYGNITDGGNPPSGLASVSAGLGAITTGQSAATLSAGTFAIGAISYGFRSASLAANAVLAPASYLYSITSKDLFGNSRTQSGFPVIVDNTAPTASDVQTANKPGNLVGRPEIGDSMVYTFSEQIDPGSILAGWNGTATSVVARITNTANDPFTIFNAANTAQLAIGSVNLGRNDYVSESATFGASGTASTMVQSGSVITVTLGAASAGPSTAATNGTMIWSPSVTAYDRAGNAETSATRTESGTADKEF